MVYYLSGLTCTDENFVTKAGAQQYAAALGVAVVAPDTSPRGEGVADDPEGSYDMGLGAGFTSMPRSPWSAHYHMYDYVVTELPQVGRRPARRWTHRVPPSWGTRWGHGALTIGLKNPDRYASFLPSHPSWRPSALGTKAFTRIWARTNQPGRLRHLRVAGSRRPSTDPY
ncbi:MAG: hypothetical protein CM15mP74_29570 [Halieaceae bacterium]|nr:MAG: hypothetical protein CM15mP74_29570 [Halieaceae bacterium]